MTNDYEILFDGLIDFVLKESYKPNYKITPNTRIVQDLGMDGDDGVEFMIAYGKKFNVDLSGFMADKYFEGEGLQLINSLLGKLGLRKSKLKPLLIKHLQKGIDLGYLNETVLSA